jgi:glycosyltransferase involved in cell wall biosynthesis
VKLLYLITRTDDLGGAQVHVRDLACRLAREGHEVVVASGPGTLPEYRRALEEAGVSIRHLAHLAREIRPLADLKALGEITRLCAGEKPDLVSLHSSKTGILGRIAARRARVRCVFTAHGWSFTTGVPWLRALLYRIAERTTIGICSAVVTVCEFDRRLALEAGVGRPERLVTIRNGMPDVAPELRGASAVGPAPRAPHPALEGEAVRIIMVARFGPQKDHSTVLKAMANLARESAAEQTGLRLPGSPPPVELLFVGNGPSEYALRREAYDLGIDDRVRFLGTRGDVPELLAASDIFVLATNWEGLPRSIIEALRAGLPVVATDLAGIPELVAEGENGYLVPRGDARALASRLAELIADDELRARLGARSRRRFEEEFSFKRMYEQTRTLYETVHAGLAPGGAVS